MEDMPVTGSNVHNDEPVEAQSRPVPHTNLQSSNTKNIGTWSEGVTEGAKGYGFVTVTPSSVTLEVLGANGVLRHSLTL